MRSIILVLITSLLLIGCRPYQVDIQQGNVLDKKMLAKIHPGLTKKQVATVLGSPVLDTNLEPNTWVYAYTKQVNGGKIIKKKLILKFKNNKLVKIN